MKDDIRVCDLCHSVARGVEEWWNWHNKTTEYDDISWYWCEACSDSYDEWENSRMNLDQKKGVKLA